MRDLLYGPLREAATEGYISWGVSVEDRKHDLPSIADLQDTPAQVRFLSVELISNASVQWFVVYLQTS
jgi:protein gp37